MSCVVVAVTVALFLGGVVTGVAAAIALAIRREDRRYSLVREASDRISRSARRLTGVGRRGLDAEFFPVARELMH
jgi:MFS superfamily sulfate permease-like transporter